VASLQTVEFKITVKLGVSHPACARHDRCTD